MAEEGIEIFANGAEGESTDEMLWTDAASEFL